MTFDINLHFNSTLFKPTDFYSTNPPGFEPHPNPIAFDGGRPNNGFYPIESIQVNLKSKPFDHTISNDPVLITEVSEDKDHELDIKTALQYGDAKGSRPLLNLVDNITQQLHHPKHTLGLDYLLTSGSGDSLTKILQAFLSPGDTILVESYTYTPIFAPITTLGGVLIPYKVNFTDGDSIVDINYLGNLLENWESGEYKHLRKPKLIYTVPTQNPSGLTQSLRIRKSIYDLAETHDLVILEDDPDSYIKLHNLESFDNYLAQIKNESYLNLDTAGRVIHFETFSKLISPGIRLGYIIAIPQIIERITKVSKIFTKATSGYSQLIIFNIIKHWAEQINSKDNISLGYFNWSYKVSLEYQSRKNLVFSLLSSSKSLAKGYISLVEPDGGMFFILPVNFPFTSNNEGNEDYTAEWEKLRLISVKNGVKFILGSLMSFNEKDSQRAKFARITLANEDDLNKIEVGVNRLDQSIVEYFEVESQK
ncbi:hypothetical protein WICMUC_002756 [Wickerhamomyces mucosus]|uniref:Aminotransferase class I/classII large domain-containing protein n=1 Tax=Wickerhamomyces mucosus TaxID=1378264 RepID=A0A9P8PNP2_9ASCO|nr:hypothetical protein WICMUC_002756 [Wickerhamomyces mucosus]